MKSLRDEIPLCGMEMAGLKKQQRTENFSVRCLFACKLLNLFDQAKLKQLLGGLCVGDVDSLLVLGLELKPCTGVIFEVP